MWAMQESGMKLFEHVSKRKSLCQIVFSKRSNCSASKIFISSAQVSSNRVFDINLKSVHAACNGSGYTGFKRLFIIGPSTASDRKKHLTIY